MKVSVTKTKKAYTPWQIYYRDAEGERKREFRKSKKLAEARAEEIRADLAQFGQKGFFVSTEDRHDLATIKDLLKECPQANIVEIVRDWVNKQAREASPLLPDAAELFLEAKSNQGLRDASVHDLRIRLRKFVRDAGEVRVCDVTPRMAQDFLDHQNISALSLANSRRVIGTFFNWCKHPSRGFCEHNPFESVSVPKPRKGAPEYYKVEEVQAMLDILTQHPELDLLAYYALQLFAGIRPDEAARMSYEDIDFANKTINVRAEVSKVHERRYLENLPGNVFAWLEKACIQPDKSSSPVITTRSKRKRNKDGIKCGSIVPTGWQNRCKRFRQLCRDRKLPVIQDGCRHSFATYHVALFENTARTALIMGHHGNDILFKHYRGIAPQSSARAYFSHA